MLCHAKAARAGVYDYLGVEVDPEGKTFKAADTVKVYRPASEVFDKASLASFVLRPITDDHPTVAVNASNWRDHAGGTIVGAVKDGDHVGFDLAFMDAGTVAKVDAGKVELSAGYSCDLAIEDGTAPDGTAYQAVQRNIRGNHVALVDRGRAGPTCRVIADAAPCSTAPQSILDSLTSPEKIMKTLVIDGLTVDMGNADTAIATVQTLIAARDAATGKVTGLQTDVATKDAEIARLTAENKTLTDAKPTPAQLRDAARAFAVVADKAKGSGVAITDAMDEAAIRKAVVDAKLGATAASYTADQIAVAFDVLTKDVKPATQAVQPIGAPQVIADAAARETAALTKANDHNAWRTAAAA